MEINCYTIIGSTLIASYIIYLVFKYKNGTNSKKEEKLREDQSIVREMRLKRLATDGKKQIVKSI